MSDSEKPSIRFTFVEMLFALTIGEIAVQAATVVQNQRTSIGFTAETLWEARCAFIHLALAIAVIATSWVGWSSSKATGNKEDSKEIFSLPFVVLLVDLLLVVFYFILARNVDRPQPASKKFINDRDTEALWIFVIFSGYAIWDLLTKFRRTTDEREKKLAVSRAVLGHRYIARGWASLVCAAAAFLTYWTIPSPVDDKGEAAGVVIGTDLSLLAIVLMFRAMKQGSAAPEDKPAWPFIDIANERYRNSRRKGAVATAVTLLAWVIFFFWSKSQ